MAKYRVLLAGKNTIIKEDFFHYMSDAFCTVTTSMNNYDFLNHIDFFKPDIFVYCLNDDKKEELFRLTEYRTKLEVNGIVSVVVGSVEECENFQKLAFNMAELVLQKPITASAIKEQILQHMEELEKQREELEKRSILEQEMLEKMKESQRKHVLVIDDDPIMLKMIKEYLHEKYDVATAINGKIARKFLENKKTNLILLDYEMPGENGPEVFHKLREREDLVDIPIIFLTGVSDKEKIKQALVLKPQGYILKPIDKEKLTETIEKFI